MDHFGKVQKSVRVRSTKALRTSNYLSDNNIPSSFVEFFASTPLDQQNILTQEQIAFLDSEFARYLSGDNEYKTIAFSIGSLIQDISLYILYLIVKKDYNFDDALYRTKSILKIPNPGMHISIGDTLYDIGEIAKQNEWILTLRAWENSFYDNILPPELKILRLTKGTLSKGTKATKKVTTKDTSPKFNTFVEFFSQDFLSPQDILTQEQIKSIDDSILHIIEESRIEDIARLILILVAIGVNFDTAVTISLLKDEENRENLLTDEQFINYEELSRKIENSFVTGEKLPDELLEGGAFSITTKEKEKKAKLKKTILISVGATAIIGGLIYFARKK